MNRRLFIGIFFIAIGGGIFLNAREPNYASITQTYEFLSKPYSIDKIYKSMMGPESTESFTLLNVDPPELIWITGYKAVMVDEDGQTPLSQEYMCHSNFDYNREQRSVTLKKTYHPIRRIFTLSQGQYDIYFPRGFGIPVMSNEVFDLQTQVLNLNHENPNIKVRHKISIEYIRDYDLKKPLIPLFAAGAQGMVLVQGDNSYFGEAKGSDKGSQGCGLEAPIIANAEAAITDKYGKQFSGHWVVPKGQHENRTHATQFLEVPYDTTAHYIAVHLHPFAQHMELWDRSDNRLLFRANARNPADRIGLEHVDYYSSVRGIPIFKDHEYEVVTLYNNTSEVEQDAMAVMYIFLKDKIFSQ